MIQAFCNTCSDFRMEKTSELQKQILEKQQTGLAKYSSNCHLQNIPLGFRWFLYNTNFLYMCSIGAQRPHRHQSVLPILNVSLYVLQVEL